MNIKYYETLDSTNAEARRLICQNDVVKSFAIQAGCQSHGRGQKDRLWHSPEGGLYITLALSMNEFKNINVSNLPLIFGKVLADFLLDSFRVGTQLKWPNDLFAKQEKLAGILCEKFKDYILVGIGVNVLNRPSLTEDDSSAISIAELTRRQDINLVKLGADLVGFWRTNCMPLPTIAPIDVRAHGLWIDKSDSSLWEFEKLASDGGLHLKSLSTAKSLKLVSAEHSFVPYMLLKDRQQLIFLDIGNTRTKTYVFDRQHKLVFRRSFSSLDEMKEHLSNCALGHRVIYYSSVNTSQENLVKTKLQPQYVLSSIDKKFLNIVSDYPVEQLGHDRIVQLEGAVARGFNQDATVIIVSAGTSLTVDVLDSVHRHHGGYVTAGLQMQLDALNDNTSLLPRLNFSQTEDHKTSLAMSTRGSMLQGVLAKTCYFLRGLREDLQSGLQDSVCFVFTGGDGQVLATQLGGRYEPDLGAFGMYALCQGDGVPSDAN